MEYTEEYLKKCDEKTIKYLYENQYDEDKGNIPSIDMIKEEGDIVYKIYCYNNFNKYLCRIFNDPDSNFEI